MSLEPNVIVRCLERCGSYKPGDAQLPCDSCPYDDSCDQLLLDAAELIREAYLNRDGQDDLYDHRVTWYGGGQDGD